MTELELRQNLAGALSSDQMAKLVKNEHSIWTQPYITTINKLENYESALKVAREEKANLAKVLAQSGQNNGKQKSTKRSRESNTKKGEKPKCNTCGKHHHGECRFKKNKSSSKPWQKGGKSSDLRQMSQQLKFLLKKETKPNEDTLSVSSSDDETPDWRCGINETQAMYVATEFCAENDLSYDDRITHINPDDRNRYLKQFKKARRY